MPTGTSVRIDLVGPAPAIYYVVVAERAEVRAGLDGAPTVALRLPANLWLRLTGGRESADPHVGQDLEIEGDEALGRQLATNLAFTI
jgi:hypothetical protein